MTEKTLDPIYQAAVPPKPTGRKADLLAALVAGIGSGLSILTALWFFIGFAENDTRPEHLTSAFVLTCLLFAFAVIPFSLVSRFAWIAYRKTARLAHLFWTVLLMVPWVGLGVLTITHTPLPIWCGYILTGLAGILSLWAIISVILERMTASPNTSISQQNEMSDEVD